MNIRKIIREELNKLDENITSGQSIVWHRTKKYHLEDIQKKGYIVGAGSAVGDGIYACFDFESQLDDYNRYYGNVIIECKIKSLDGFLIMFPQEAKNVYGFKNAGFDNQLRRIFKEETYKKVKIKLTDKICEAIDNGDYEKGDGIEFYQKYLSPFEGDFKGLVYNAFGDGKSIVCYNTNNIIPLRYTEDEGDSWQPFTDKNVYASNKQELKDVKKDYSNFESYQIYHKLKNAPELVSRFSKEQLYGLDIENTLDLIVKHPDLANNLDITKFSEESVKSIIEHEPKLKKYFDKMNVTKEKEVVKPETQSIFNKIKNYFKK